MARDLSSIVKQSRREGYALHPKAHKALVKRSTPPGQGASDAGRRRPKTSQYALQLREKQKAKIIYGLMEKQFRKYYESASKKVGITGDKSTVMAVIKVHAMLDGIASGALVVSEAVPDALAA